MVVDPAAGCSRSQETLWINIQYDGRYQGDGCCYRSRILKAVPDTGQRKISSLYSKAHAKKVLVDIKGESFDRKEYSTGGLYLLETVIVHERKWQKLLLFIVY